MDKQESINHIKDQNEWLGNHRFILIKKEELISMIEDLDQPQKVKVPAFVAEYIESHRKWGPEIFIGDWLADNDAVDKWLYNNSEKENNRRFLIAVKAFVEGYEVEGEPKWVVQVGNLYFCGWEDTTAQFVMNTMLGEEELIIKYKNEGTASAVAKNLGGTVEKVEVRE